MTTVRVVPDMDLNKDGKVSLGELISSGFVIFLGIFTLLLLLAGSIWILFFADAVLGVKVVAGSLFISSTIAIVVVLFRMFRYERGERKAQEEWLLELKRKKFEIDQIMGISERENDTAWTNAIQDRYARLYLQISFKQNQIVTREEWTSKRLSEDAWNRINRLMVKHHIRKGRGRDLQHETLAEAWGAWCDAMLKSRSWVKSGEEYLKD